MVSVMVVLAVSLGVGFTCYYAWYLARPVVTGTVTRVDIGISDNSRIRSAREYRLITYAYELEGRSYLSARQGLFVKAALGPRKMEGEEIRVSVCRPVKSLSCPRRPLFEVMILLAIVALFGLAALLAVLPAA